MSKIEEQKIKLEQKKTRLIQEEAKLKLKERRVRTRTLIELGGLVVKANLSQLPPTTLYGALLSLQTTLQSDPKITSAWEKTGQANFALEQQDKTPIILTFAEKPAEEIRQLIREYGLKWNPLRQEWYGYVHNLPLLKQQLTPAQFNIQIIPTN